jgi:hypothetical protein
MPTTEFIILLLFLLIHPRNANPETPQNRDPNPADLMCVDEELEDVDYMDVDEHSEDVAMDVESDTDGMDLD